MIEDKANHCKEAISKGKPFNVKSMVSQDCDLGPFADLNPERLPANRDLRSFEEAEEVSLRLAKPQIK